MAEDPPAGETVLELRDLSRVFGPHTVVDNVSLRLRRGEFFSLIGPSGCGKTTTLRMIAGLEETSSGQITLAGADVTKAPAHKRNVHTVFQNYALFPHLTVAENVAFGLKERRHPSRAIKEKVARMLELVELTGREDARPRELSGGMQQRVALARSLVLDPAVLLLDEPLGALDLRLRRQLQLLLKTVQREVGITFVYVTHDQEEAFSMSDRVGVMSGGVLVQVGTPREIYERPRTRFVANFVGAVNQLPARVVSRVGPDGGPAAGEPSAGGHGGGTNVDADVAIFGPLRLPADPVLAGTGLAGTGLAGTGLAGTGLAGSGGPASTEAVCVVRPEVPVLTFGPAGAPDSDQAAARCVVTDVSFAGPQTTLTLRSADGEPLTLVVPSHRLPASLSAGDHVRVTVRAEDLWLIPA
jgi:spermidine/putrescine transport system ATP-binding protein